jgi:hypothetical protein
VFGSLVRRLASGQRPGAVRRPGARRESTTSQGRRSVDGAAAEQSYDLDAVEQTRRRLEAVKRRRGDGATKGKTRTPQNAPVEGRPIQPVLEDDLPSS